MSVQSVNLPVVFEGIAAKLARADETADRLETETENYLAIIKSEIKIRSRLNSKGTRLSIRVSGNIYTPPIFSVLLGEIVHQFRTVLDHLIWLLCEKNGETPTRRLQFPASTTSRDFESALTNGQLKGLSDSAVAFVDKLQPYHIDNPLDHLLYILHRLDIIDKHRNIITAAAGGHLGAEVRLSGGQGLFDITGIGPPVVVPISESEREFFWITVSPPQSDFDADVAFAPKLCVTDVGSSNIRTLETLISRCSDFTKGVILESVALFD